MLELTKQICTQISTNKKDKVAKAPRPATIEEVGGEKPISKKQSVHLQAVMNAVSDGRDEANTLIKQIEDDGLEMFVSTYQRQQTTAAICVGNAQTAVAQIAIDNGSSSDLKGVKRSLNEVKAGLKENNKKLKKAIGDALRAKTSSGA